MNVPCLCLMIEPLWRNLADAPDLGSGGEIRGGSNPLGGILEWSHRGLVRCPGKAVAVTRSKVRILPIPFL